MNIEEQAAAFADAEMVKLDTDPALTDIALWEKHLGIADAATRALFDDRVVLARTGAELDQPWNDHLEPDHVVRLALYATHAAELRNPVPAPPIVPPPGYVDDPHYAEGVDKMDAIIEHEMFSRDALRKSFARQRRDELELDVYRDEQRRRLTSTPVVLEGELISRS